MKLLFAIVRNEDEKPLIRALVENELSVTRISSSGGFLRSGNATLMIGVEDERLGDALDVIKSASHRKTELITSYTPATGIEAVPMPISVNVGGATVFVVDIESFHKF